MKELENWKPEYLPIIVRTEGIELTLEETKNIIDEELRQRAYNDILRSARSILSEEEYIYMTSDAYHSRMIMLIETYLSLSDELLVSASDVLFRSAMFETMSQESPDELNDEEALQSTEIDPELMITDSLFHDYDEDQ